MEEEKFKLQDLMLRPEVSFEQVKKEILADLEQYKNIVVTEDNCYELSREIGGKIRRIDEERKRLKKEYQKPLKAFEKKVKEIVKLAEEIKAPIAEVYAQVEERRKKDKVKLIMALAKNVFGEAGLQPRFQSRFEIDKKWLAKSRTVGEIEVLIRTQVSELKSVQKMCESNEQTFKTTLALQNESIGLITPVEPEELSSLFNGFEKVDVLIEEVTRRIIARRQAEQNIIDKVEDMIQCVIDFEEDWESLDKMKEEIGVHITDIRNPKDWIKSFIGGK